MKTGVVPVDGMVISEDTRFAPGVYVLANGVSIAADDIALEGAAPEDGGTLLVSPKQEGVGIRVQGRRNVTLRGLRLSGYYHAIRCDDCTDVAIENVQVRGTHEIEGIDIFLYLWQPLEIAYGGAILLNNVQSGTIRACDLQHQMNGILLYGCSQLTVERNNASFNSGRGIHLTRTSNCTVTDNSFDFCNRLYRRPEDGSIRAEADTAGIVLVKASSRNRFLRNSCIGGGDGIFVCGYEHPGMIDPCNDNLFEDNDCRLSPNNAIESTFCKGNIFRRNNCSRSNYGFWMGFSWENTLEDNLIEFNRFVGIAAEHAHDFVIRSNTIRLNGEGVRLWTRGGAVVPYWKGFEVSYSMTLENNTFETNRLGFAGYTGEDVQDQECYGYHLRGNVFKDNRVGAQFARVHGCTLINNEFEGNIEAALRLINQPGVETADNRFVGNRVDQDDVTD